MNAVILLLLCAVSKNTSFLAQRHCERDAVRLKQVNVEHVCTDHL